MPVADATRGQEELINILDIRPKRSLTEWLKLTRPQD